MCYTIARQECWKWSDFVNTKEISLALGGGGAKGNAHIGILRRLEGEGFVVRAVAGTSFGGIVAAMYAAGFSPDEIESRFCLVDQAKLYGRASNEGPSLLGLAGARKWFQETFGNRTFSDLKLPCALTAVDVNNVREVILREGSLGDALLATIAIPGVFPPHCLDGQKLVDGGVLDPVPVAAARGLVPALPVVAVVLTERIGEPIHSGLPMPLPDYIPAPLVERLAQFRFAQALDIFLRSVDISTRLMTELRLEADEPDVVIRPDVHDISLLDKVSVPHVARLGERAVDAALPELNRAVSWPNRLRVRAKNRRRLS
jgi:NTE family protein